MGLDPISAVADLVNTAVSRIWPDKTEAEKAKSALLLTELQQGFQLIVGQLDINKEEAKSQSWWVAGWRPYCGWICGTSLAYHYIIQPFLSFILAAIGHPVALPVLNVGELTTILLGMLGLGGLRSFDKKQGNGK